MPNPTQVPSILTVIEDGTEYIIRASTERGKRLAVTITTLLLEATKITLVTDTDVKVFKNDIIPVPIKKPTLVRSDLEEERQAEAVDINTVAIKPIPASQRIIQDSNAPPAPELAEEDYEAELRKQEAEAANFEKMQKINKQSPISVQQEEEATEQPPRLRRKAEAPLAPGSACGRCGGAGQLLAGDVEVRCNVCQGKGTIVAWGRQRGRGSSFKDKAR